MVLPDGKTRYELVVYNKLDWKVGPLSSTEPLIYKTEHYNLFLLHPVTRAVIFAYEALTPTQVMEKLLDGYRPKET